MVNFTQEELEFLYTAVLNFHAFGHERDSAMRKIRESVPRERLEELRRVWKPREPTKAV